MFYTALGDPGEQAVPLLDRYGQLQVSIEEAVMQLYRLFAEGTGSSKPPPQPGGELLKQLRALILFGMLEAVGNEAAGGRGSSNGSSGASHEAAAASKGGMARFQQEQEDLLALLQEDLAECAEIERERENVSPARLLPRIPLPSSDDEMDPLTVDLPAMVSGIRLTKVPGFSPGSSWGLKDQQLQGFAVADTDMVPDSEDAGEGARGAEFYQRRRSNSYLEESYDELNKIDLLKEISIWDDLSDFDMYQDMDEAARRMLPWAHRDLTYLGKLSSRLQLTSFPEFEALLNTPDRIAAWIREFERVMPAVKLLVQMQAWFGHCGRKLTSGGGAPGSASSSRPSSSRYFKDYAPGLLSFGIWTSIERAVGLLKFTCHKANSDCGSAKDDWTSVWSKLSDVCQGFMWDGCSDLSGDEWAPRLHGYRSSDDDIPNSPVAAAVEDLEGGYQNLHEYAEGLEHFDDDEAAGARQLEQWVQQLIKHESQIHVRYNVPAVRT
eukprot:gene4146-4395_t